MPATPDPLGLSYDVYTDYGLLGLIILLIVLFVLPWFIKKLMPFLFKGWQDERKRAEQREERQTRALEELAKSNQAIAITFSAMDVRMKNLEMDVDCVKTAVLQEKPSSSRRKP
jgi:hypothetical protein